MVNTKLVTFYFVSFNPINLELFGSMAAKVASQVPPSFSYTIFFLTIYYYLFFKVHSSQISYSQVIYQFNLIYKMKYLKKERVKLIFFEFIYFLKGMVWPVQGMPVYLQYISYFLPCTLACEAMRSIVSRGVDFMHPVVWPGFASTFAWIILYWSLTVIIHRVSSKK